MAFTLNVHVKENKSRMSEKKYRLALCILKQNLTQTKLPVLCLPKHGHES